MRPKPTGASCGGLARTAALLAMFALLSRVLGLARDMVMAWLLGGSAAADALVAAMRLPHALRRMLGEGTLSMTLTASMVCLARGQGQEEKENMPLLARALAVRLGLVLGALTVCGLAAAPWLARFLAPGFGPAEQEMAAGLLRICLPYALAAGMAALGMALLHAAGVFWLPALSPGLFNASMLVLAGVAALGFVPPATGLALGMLCGGLVQWLAQWLAVRRLLPRPRARPDPLSAQRAGKTAWRCLARLPVGIAGAAAPQFCMLAALALASSLGQGRAAALYYAERLLELPLGLVGVCLGTASLPLLSALAAEGKLALFASRLSTALRLSLLFSLPAAAGLWAVGPHLVRGLLGHGAFDALAVRDTAQALAAFVCGLPALAANRCLLSACNALGRLRATSLSTLWAVAATLAAGVFLVHTLEGNIAAPALAVSLGMWVQCVFLLRALRAGQGSEKLSLADCLPQGRILARQALAALAAGAAARVLLGTGGASLWLALAAAVAGGILAWFCCLLALGDADARALLDRVRGRAA